jgi:photosystem II stability/assembly factor-like uncharacterized protein
MRRLAITLASMSMAWVPVRAGEELHWQHCGWGAGGFYWACAFHPAKPNVIYVGGDVAGVYKTEDKGRHWRMVNDGLADYGVFSLAVSSAQPDTVFAVTLSGLCKSTDAGESWEFLEQTGTAALGIVAQRGLSVRSVAVDPSDADVVYAGTPDGRIMKSVDGGTSWTQAHECKGGVSCIAVAAARPGLVLAAAGPGGMLRSLDAGRTWVAFPTPKDTRSVAIFPADPDVIYAACGEDGVWRSNDGGDTWGAVTGGVAAGCRVIDVAVDPTQPDTVYCVGEIGWEGHFYRSSDGGATWEPSRTVRRDFESDPTLPEDYGGRATGTCSLSRPANIAVNPLEPDELLIAGNWRLCFSQDAGRTWEQRDRGADISCITDICFCDGDVYVTAMDEGLLASEDNGRSWRQLSPLKYDPAISGHHWRVLAWPAQDAVNVVSTCSPWVGSPNQVMVSRDGGRTFRTARDGLPGYLPKVNCMWGQSYPRGLAADPRDPNVLYLGMDGDPEPDQDRPGGGAFKSVDGGLTWQRLPGQPDSRRAFYGLAVDPTVPTRLYWGACATGGGLYRSEDAGRSWARVFDDETWVFNIAVSDSGVVYCAGDNLWKSDDHGETWVRLTDFSEGASTVGLEIHPEDEATIWISRVTWGSRAVGSVQETTDGGKTWHEITGDLPYRRPLVLRFNPATDELWAGGVGLFRLPRKGGDEDSDPHGGEQPAAAPAPPQTLR